MGHGSMCSLVLLSRGSIRRTETREVGRGPGGRVETGTPRPHMRLIIVLAVIMTEKVLEAAAEGCTAMEETADPFSRQEALTTLSLKET